MFSCKQSPDAFQNSHSPRDPSARRRGIVREPRDKRRHGVGSASAAASPEATSSPPRAKRKLSVEILSPGTAGTNISPRKTHRSGKRAGRAALPHTPERANGGGTVTVDGKPPPRFASDKLAKERCTMAHRLLRDLSRNFVESREQPPSKQAPPDDKVKSVRCFRWQLSAVTGWPL